MTSAQPQLTISVYQSPLGDIDLVLDDETLVYLDFADNPERYQRLMGQRYDQFPLPEKSNKNPSSASKLSSGHQQIHQCLDNYFAGKADPFRNVKLELGGTPFQQKIWRALQKIPYGKVVDYSALAKGIGSPRAVRAAASSNARNPVSIIVPCHRVIGKDGSLRGYAGGTHRKQWLIEHERATCT